MKLFTKDIDKKLFSQFEKGADLENQMVVAKIFNPYGRGTWYILNSDPSDPDYLWAIVDLFEVEVGSVSRSELATIKVPPFGLPLERDMYFTPVNAAQLYKKLYLKSEDDLTGESAGERKAGMDEFEKGGMIMHGFKSGDTVIEIYKGYGIVENNKNGIIEVLNPNSGSRFIISLDDSKSSGSRASAEMTMDEQLKAAKDYIDQAKPLPDTYREVHSGSDEGKMANGGGISSPNTEFMKWFVDWFKNVNKYVYVSMSIPNEFSSPVKDGNGTTVLLDVIEKKGDTDAKKYLNEILKKADEFGVSIYLQPIPRTHNLMSQDHKKKITEDYLIKYYEKFGFENMDGGFMVRAPKMAEGGEVDEKMKDISYFAKQYYTFRFDSDAAASNGEDGKSMRLLDKAEGYRDEANKLIKEYNKKKKTNYTFQDFDRDGSLIEGIASGLKVPTEYNNSKAEEGRYKYVVEVKYPYRKESFITNFSSSEKDRDPSYQAALNVIKDAQKDEDFKEGHIMFDYYIKGLGRSYSTVFYTDKKKMASGGEIKKGDFVMVDNPYWKASMGKEKPVKRKVTIVVDDNVFFSDGSNSSMKYVKKMEGGGKVTFDDKVKSIKASLLKRKKVPKAVQKDYGKTFSPAEAEDSAKRIVGAMTAKERLMAKLKKRKK